MNGQQFRSLRKALGLTQAELADRMGMTQPMVSRIEAGDREPTRQQTAALILVLRLSDCNRALTESGANTGC